MPRAAWIRVQDDALEADILVDREQFFSPRTRNARFVHSYAICKPQGPNPQGHDTRSNLEGRSALLPIVDVIQRKRKRLLPLRQEPFFVYGGGSAPGG